MKLEQLKKTYSQLSQHELASLCFDAAVRDDLKEIEAITGCLPKQHAILNIGTEFCKRNSEIYTLSLLYGLFYWKTTAFMFCPNANNEANLYQLGALDQALVAVCKKFKLNIESVRTLAQCNVELETEHINSKMLEEYIEMFTNHFK